MNPHARDVARPLAYGVNAISRAFLPMGLLGLAAGLFLLWGGMGGRDLPAGIAGTAVGVAILGYAAWRRLSPAPPLLELSPAGLTMRIPGATRFTVPWREVRAVGAIDVTVEDIPTRDRTASVHFSGVTAVSVTRAFYDRVIHLDSLLLRGPGWEGTFIPNGDLVQIALHHELLRAPADELRLAVESRWRAFGGAAAREADATGTVGTSRPARAVKVAYGGGWPAIAVSIVFAILGLMAWFEVWPFDAAARREREWAEREREWAERDRQIEAARREHEAVFRKMDEDRRAREAAEEAERRRAAERLAEIAARERAELVAGGPLPPPAATRIDGHAGAVTALAVGPNQRSFVSAGADGAAKLWDVRANAALRDLGPAGAPLAAVAFAPDGASMLAGGDDGRIVWRALPDGEERRVFDATDAGPVRALRIAGDRLVSLHANGAAIVWDLAAKARRATLDAGGARRTALALSADGARAATGAEDGVVRLFDLEGAGPPRAIAGHTGAVRALALTADGRAVVSAGDDATIRLRALDSGEELRRFPGHVGPVLAVAIDAAGARLASAGADGTARLWDVATGAELLRVGEGGGAIGVVAFVNGGRFVAGSANGLIRLWDDKGVERMRYFAAPAR